MFWPKNKKSKLFTEALGRYPLDVILKNMPPNGHAVLDSMFSEYIRNGSGGIVLDFNGLLQRPLRQSFLPGTIIEIDSFDDFSLPIHQVLMRRQVFMASFSKLSLSRDDIHELIVELHRILKMYLEDSESGLQNRFMVVSGLNETPSIRHIQLLKTDGCKGFFIGKKGDDCRRAEKLMSRVVDVGKIVNVGSSDNGGVTVTYKNKN